MTFRRLEINGGRVRSDGDWLFQIGPIDAGYSDAQIDDYGGRRRSDYLWHPPTSLQLEARFSHPPGQLLGTAGFGFWNAPFGDPTVGWPTLPRAAWFFYGSEPTELPLADDRPGRGWFVATLDARVPAAWAMAPLAPLIIVLNNIQTVRGKLWPRLRRRLRINYAQLDCDMTGWHTYQLDWLPERTRFSVDGVTVLDTNMSPGGPLGFVCWLDNQYLIARPTGRFRWGTLAVPFTQWMEIKGLHLF